MLKPLTFLLMLAAPMAEAATLIETFEGAPVAEVTSGALTPIGFAPLGHGFHTTFLRSTDRISLSFGVISGSVVKLGFDLAIIDSWEGEGAAMGGPDRLAISVNGGEVLKLTFGSVYGVDAGFTPEADSDPVTETFRALPPDTYVDWGFGQWIDKSYRINLDLTHVAGSDLVIDLFHPASEGIENESFAIDNVRLDYAPVPLPASLPLLLAGFGAFGLLRRRG